MENAMEEKFRNCPFYALMAEKEKKISQFKELVLLEYEWVSSVLENLPAMLPKEEFVILPTKTPSKKKAMKGSAKPLPVLDLDDSGSNVPSTSGGLSLASTSSRASRKPKVSKAKNKQTQKVEIELPKDDDTNQGPLTLDELQCPSPIPVPKARPLRSTRASKKAAAAVTSPKQRVSTRSTRQATNRKLSTHSRNCPYSPRRAGDPVVPAASTPDTNPAEQRKQRTLRLKRNAAATKRLFLTPEKKKELFGIKVVSPFEKAKEELRSSPKKAEKVVAVQVAESAEQSCPDIAEHFMTANESPIEKNLTAASSPSSVDQPLSTRVCYVKLTPLKKDAIQRWLESADPVDLDEVVSDEEDVTAVEKENLPAPVEVIDVIKDRKSATERKSQRLSRKRSSRQAQLSEPSASSKILKEDNRPTVEVEMEVEEEKTEEEDEIKAIEVEKIVENTKKTGIQKAAANENKEVLEEEDDDKDDIAPLPAVAVPTTQAVKAQVSVDDSLITDDEWSTLNDDDLNASSILNQSSASVGQMNTPSDNRHRPRMAHSADGGTKRFSRVKRWMAADSKSNTSIDQSSSRYSNTSTPGRIQKRLSASRQQEMEEERRRELTERMQKDLKRLQERDWRLAQEREARKRANEARRQQVLSKRNAVFKEKINSIQQLWEKKEHQLAEQERERKEEDQRRKLALAQLRKQNEQREREERERREAEARRQREEAMRKMKEEAERRLREAERRAKEEAERRVKEEAAKKAREEAERRAREEAARKAREEEERRAKEEARRAAEAARRAKEEERRRREEEERKRAILRERALQLEMARKELELSALRNAAAGFKIGEQPKKSKKSEENYDISDLHSDQETDDDEDPRKKVPLWATKSAMKRKCRHFWRLNVKWWKIFRPAKTLVVDLNSIFSESKRSFRPRTSSAIWHTPPAAKAPTPRH